MSLISPNSHRNGAGSLHHAVFNPPAHCCLIETGLAGSCMTATVRYAAVCSVGCDELSSDGARAHRWRPAGQPGLFFVLCVTKRPVHFRAPVPPCARLSRHLYMRHFARALRSGWVFCWRAPRATDCSLSLER